MEKNEKTAQNFNYGPKTLQILNNTMIHQRRFAPHKAEELLVDLSKENSLVARLQEYFPENCRRNLTDDEKSEESLKYLKLQKKYLRKKIREHEAAESGTVREKKELAYRKIARWLSGEIDIQKNPGYYHRTAAPVPENTKEESKGALRPLYLKDVNSTREVMYAFCGIMGFDAQETAEFFWKVAFQPPFKRKVWTEQVYYYFARIQPPKDGNWYAAAQDLIAELEQQMDAAPNDIAPVQVTQQLISDADGLKSSEELKAFLLKNRSSFRLDNFNYSAKITIQDLYKKGLRYAKGADPEVSTVQEFFELLFLVEDSRSYDLYDMVWKDIVNNYFSAYSSSEAQETIRRLEAAGMWKEPWEDALENRKRKVSGCEESEDEHTEVLRKKRVTLGDKQKLNLSGVTEITSTKELENYLISHRDHFYYSLLSVTSMDAFYTCLFDSGWSDAILANFPTPAILDGIMQDEQELRDTALRKMLILLYFYHFYAQLRHNKCAALKCLPNPERGYRHCVDDLQNYSTYFSEFQKNLNPLLARCGFDGLYPRNPYDCLFLLAASSAHPLEALPAMLINGPPSAKPKEPKRTRAPKKQKSEA